VFEGCADGGEEPAGRYTGPERKKKLAVAAPAPNTATNLTAGPKEDMGDPVPRGLNSRLRHMVPSAVLILSDRIPLDVASRVPVARFPVDLDRSGLQTALRMIVRRRRCVKNFCVVRIYSFITLAADFFQFFSVDDSYMPPPISN
jgi:hypothetical protein